MAMYIPHIHLYAIYHITKFDSLRKRISRAKYDQEYIPMVLCGNKCDVPKDNRQVTKAMGKKLAKEWEIPFCETSAKDQIQNIAVFHELVRQIQIHSHDLMDGDMSDDESKNEAGGLGGFFGKVYSGWNERKDKIINACRYTQSRSHPYSKRINPKPQTQNRKCQSALIKSNQLMHMKQQLTMMKEKVHKLEQTIEASRQQANEYKIKTI